MLWVWFRRFVMIVVPLVLVVLEHGHAVGFTQDVFSGLLQQATWWKWLHIYQAFLFAGVAVGVLLLTIDINNIWATLSRIFLWFFLVAYLVFDSTAGISVGFILEKFNQDPTLNPYTVKTLVQSLFWDPIIGGTTSILAQMGSFAWLFAVIAAIIALYHKYRVLPWWKLLPPLVLLAISGYCLYVGHYPPYGPLAFGSFALAGLWFEFFQFRIGEELYQKTY